MENQNELDNEDNTNSQIQREEPEMTGENTVCVGEQIDNVETNVRNRRCGYKGSHFSLKRIYHFSEMLAKEAEISKEEDLGDIFVTAMNLKPEERIKMQSAWQKNIDASISSTVNLPYEATVEDVYDVYMEAWKHGLKGITIYRDGCSRGAVLINEKKDDKKEIKIVDPIKEKRENNKKTMTVCPDCGTELEHGGGCVVCPQCGWSACH